MRRVIRFTRLRYIMITLSLLVIVSGYVGLYLRGGFNLGIDFKGGLTEQFQIAPVALTLSYTGEGKATLLISKGETVGQASGTLDITLSRNGKIEKKSFPFKQYATLGRLVEALGSIDGLKVELKADEATPSTSLISLDYPVDLSKEPFSVNRLLQGNNEIYVTITELRKVFTTLGKYSLQQVGNPVAQEFIVRIEANETDKEFRQKTEKKIYDLLSAKYGSDQVIIKKTDFVGPRFSRDLTTQAISLVTVALTLILIYVSFRFKFIYAIAAILALVHDVSVMLGVIGTFQLEVTTATIAAVLTIIGYSLNDTIVIFDRIRENVNLMRDEKLSNIIDISITQSLSRTLITSLTTLLAVLAIYIFGTGSIKLFALNLIVGIVVGTYSSIFIASPIVLEWYNAVDRRRLRRDTEKYGRKENLAPAGSRDKEKKKDQAVGKEAIADKVGSEGASKKVTPVPVIQERRPKKKKKKKKR